MDTTTKCTSIFPRWTRPTSASSITTRSPGCPTALRQWPCRRRCGTSRPSARARPTCSGVRDSTCFRASSGTSRPTRSTSGTRTRRWRPRWRPEWCPLESAPAATRACWRPWPCRCHTRRARCRGLATATPSWAPCWPERCVPKTTRTARPRPTYARASSTRWAWRTPGSRAPRTHRRTSRAAWPRPS